MMTRREHILACLTAFGVPDVRSFTLGGSRAERQLRRALTAMIEDKVEWLRSTHKSLTINMGVFDWPFGSLENWHVITCNEHWGWTCDRLEFFKTHWRSVRRQWPDDLRALINCELAKAAEGMIEKRLEDNHDAR